MDANWTDAAIRRAVREAETVQRAVVEEKSDLDPGYRALAKGIAEFEEITKAASATILPVCDESRRYAETQRPEDFWPAYRQRLQRLAHGAAVAALSQRSDVTAQELVDVLVTVARPGLATLPVFGPAVGMILAMGIQPFFEAEAAQRAA